MFSLDRDKDTICAVSTAPGAGAIAVVRLSGDKALEITKSVTRGLPNDVESHRVYYAFIVDHEANTEIDEVLITYFAGNRSFTAEPVVEISCHGNPVITEEILRTLISYGARAAQPGEFTYRAFSNGRIDLVQAESVLNLIESRSKQAARVSLRQVQGVSSKKISEIIESLTWSLAQLEANIDFSAEDIVVTAPQKITTKIEDAQERLESLINSYKTGRILYSGLRIAIAGEPNVGKSSLFNKILARERSIVSPEAGTTRDTVEGDMVLSGLRVTFVDTAGIRETTNEIEALGVERSREALQEADLTLLVFDARDEGGREKLKGVTPQTPHIFVANKSDLVTTTSFAVDTIVVSASTGVGIDQLLQRIIETAKGEGESENAAILSVRQFELLSIAVGHVREGRKLLQNEASGEFVISEIQIALKSCMQILGHEFDDQVIDRVFKDFCLGK
jgi:tRNA modification GTPase